MEQKSLGT